jgi:Holliday junction resolvase RusA-like endonuclease
MLAMRSLPDKPMDGALALELRFDMPIPAGTSKKKRAAMLAGQIPHIKKPDIDNLAKFVADCLNRLAWRDDCQVVALNAIKAYAENPATITRLFHGRC